MHSKHFIAAIDSVPDPTLHAARVSSLQYLPTFLIGPNPRSHIPQFSFNEIRAELEVTWSDNKIQMNLYKPTTITFHGTRDITRMQQPTILKPHHNIPTITMFHLLLLSSCFTVVFSVPLGGRDAGCKGRDPVFQSRPKDGSFMRVDMWLNRCQAVLQSLRASHDFPLHPNVSA